MVVKYANQLGITELPPLQGQGLVSIPLWAEGSRAFIWMVRLHFGDNLSFAAFHRCLEKLIQAGQTIQDYIFKLRQHPELFIRLFNDYHQALTRVLPYELSKHTALSAHEPSHEQQHEHETLIHELNLKQGWLYLFISFVWRDALIYNPYFAQRVQQIGLNQHELTRVIQKSGTNNLKELREKIDAIVFQGQLLFLDILNWMPCEPQDMPTEMQIVEVSEGFPLVNAVLLELKALKTFCKAKDDRRETANKIVKDAEDLNEQLKKATLSEQVQILQNMKALYETALFLCPGDKDIQAAHSAVLAKETELTKARVKRRKSEKKANASFDEAHTHLNSGELDKAIACFRRAKEHIKAGLELDKRKPRLQHKKEAIKKRLEECTEKKNQADSNYKNARQCLKKAKEETGLPVKIERCQRALQHLKEVLNYPEAVELQAEIQAYLEAQKTRLSSLTQHVEAMQKVLGQGTLAEQINRLEQGLNHLNALFSDHPAYAPYLSQLQASLEQLNLNQAQCEALYEEAQAILTQGTNFQGNKQELLVHQKKARSKLLEAFSLSGEARMRETYDEVCQQIKETRQALAEDAPIPFVSEFFKQPSGILPEDFSDDSLSEESSSTDNETPN